LILTGEPAQAQAGKGEGFGEAGDGDTFLVEIGNGGKTGGGIVFEEAVHFVAEQVEVMATGDGDNGIQFGTGGEKAGGVVRKVDDEEAGGGGDERFQLIDGEVPVIAPGLNRPGGDGTSQGSGNF